MHVFKEYKGLIKTMESNEQKPKEQKPEERIHNFNEVCFGYTKEQAIKEAKRCLQCPVPLCEKGCPADISIKKFIKHISNGKFDLALKTILEKNSLPGICGRVCPAEEQCKKSCISKPAINIALLERFAADNSEKIIKNMEKISKRIAVVGSGPAGLACSSDFALLGYEVVVCAGMEWYGFTPFTFSVNS